MCTYITVKTFTCLSSDAREKRRGKLVIDFGMPTLSFCLIAEYNMVQIKRGLYHQ